MGPGKEMYIISLVASNLYPLRYYCLTFPINIFLISIINKIFDVNTKEICLSSGKAKEVDAWEAYLSWLLKAVLRNPKAMNWIVKASDGEEAAICGFHLNTKKSKNIHSLKTESLKLSITKVNILTQHKYYEHSQKLIKIKEADHLENLALQLIRANWPSP